MDLRLVHCIKSPMAPKMVIATRKPVAKIAAAPNKVAAPINRASRDLESPILSGVGRSRASGAEVTSCRCNRATNSGRGETGNKAPANVASIRDTSSGGMLREILAK